MTVDWRRVAFTAASCVLVAIAAFSAGRFSAPVEIDERVEYRTEWRTREVTRWRTARAVDTKTTSTPVLLPVPDGGVVLATATTTETREREHADGTATTDTSGNTAGSSTRTVTLRPDWRVGVQAGASLVAPAVPLTGPLVIGVSVERRIVGGVSAGLWANTVGAAGASLSVEF